MILEISNIIVGAFAFSTECSLRYHGFGSYTGSGWDPTSIRIDPPDDAFGVVYLHGRT